MKALVIYDSNYGNTKKIAEVVAKELGTKAISVSDFHEKHLDKIDLIVVGSPINGWKPTVKTLEVLAKLEKTGLKNMKAAAFDTRVTLFIHGDAASKISKALENAGAEIIAKPGAFIVKGKEGPLAEGETEKASVWARSIKAALEK